MKLEPCPFCNSVHLEIVNGECDDTYRAIQCNNCGALGPGTRLKGQATVTEAWNKRPLYEKLRKEIDKVAEFAREWGFLEHRADRAEHDDQRHQRQGQRPG